MHNIIFTRLFGFTLVCTTVILAGFGAQQAVADTAAQIDGKVDLALEALYKKTPAAKKQAESAKGILVCPDVLKAGLMAGLGLKGSEITKISPDEKCQLSSGNREDRLPFPGSSVISASI